LHSKLEKDSVEVNPKLADVELVVPEGPELIEVSGGVVSGGGISGAGSTVQVSLAGVGSTLPELSVARTEKLCEPMFNPEYALGDPHERHLDASSLHWKVEPDVVAVKSKLAEVAEVGDGGSAVIRVSGGVELQV
jgi:hypothetical protein